MNLEFAKTLYFRELDRRAELDQAPTFRIAVLAILGGIFSYYLDSYQLERDPSSIFFLLCAALTAVFAVLSIIWVIRSYLGYYWTHIPYASQMLAYYEELEDYHRNYGLDGSDPDETFARDLRARLVEATTQNASNNNSRSELLYAASRFLAIAVVFTLLAGIPVVLDSVKLV